MEKNLAVPYKSQHDPDSTGSNNDCGAASLAMVLEFFGRKTTTGEILEKLGNPKGFITFAQLTKVAQDLGFNVSSKVDATFGELKRCIDKGLPAIVCGGYGYLQSTQDKKFKASHIMVVTGYREDDSVYANDPNFKGEFRLHGDHHIYTGPEFFTFWRNENNKEGNQPNILFVVAPKEVAQEIADKNTPKKVVITSDLALNGRTEPKRVKGNSVRSYTKNTELEVVKKVSGENVEGNDVWYLIKDEPNLYIWSGATQVVKTDEPKKPEPKPESPKNPGAEPSAEVPSTSGITSSPQGGSEIEHMQMIYKVARNYLISKNALPKEEGVTEVSWFQKLKDALRIH